MKKPSWNHLMSTAQPWFSLLICSESELKAFLLEKPQGQDLYVAEIRGEKSKRVSPFFKEAAEALRFPDYFGHNWDAFEECINDLTWLPQNAFVIVIVQADKWLADDEMREIAMDILDKSARQWNEGVPMSFHVIFQCESAQEAILRNRLNADQLNL